MYASSCAMIRLVGVWFSCSFSDETTFMECLFLERYRWLHAQSGSLIKSIWIIYYFLRAAPPSCPVIPPIWLKISPSRWSTSGPPSQTTRVTSSFSAGKLARTLRFYFIFYLFIFTDFLWCINAWKIKTYLNIWSLLVSNTHIMNKQVFVDAVNAPNIASGICAFRMFFFSVQEEFPQFGATFCWSQSELGLPEDWWETERRCCLDFSG